MNKRDVDIGDLITPFILKVLGFALGLIIGGIIVTARWVWETGGLSYVIRKVRGR